MSPRIVWLGFLKWLGVFAKIACVLGVCAGIGWGAWRGIQQAFLKNPDFRLRVITLNANPVIDELGVAAAAGIDLSLNPSLFDIDVQDVCRKLKSMPAIADAHVERHMPATLAVSVVPRTPIAWISCPGAGLKETRHAGNLLVDHAGVAYPCPERQVESCAALPVIELPSSGENPLKEGEKIRQPELGHCRLLLDAARAADPDAMQWIGSVKQVNEWSLLLVTRQGTTATFGLGDHARQIESLRAALDHAGEKGYLIDTINLIPKYNIPITLRSEPASARTEVSAPHAEPAPAHAESSPAAHAEPAPPRAKPASARAESSSPRTKPSSARAESASTRTKSASARTEPTPPRAKPVSARAESAPPRAKPVTPRAESTPPRAIPLAAQNPSRESNARRSRDSGNNRN